MSSQVAAPHKEPRPWTRSDIASAMFVFIVVYGLSPPWVIALSRIFHAPAFILNAIAFFYHPLSIVRQTYPPLDYFYTAYRTFLNPYLSGS